MTDWALLAPLDDESRRDVLASARRRKFRRGDILFHEGDPADTLHLVAAGALGVRVTTPLGDVAMVNVLTVGDHVGELAVVSPAPRNATVSALTAAETLAIHRSELEALQSRAPEVRDVLIEALVASVRRLTEQLLEAMYVPVERRIPRRLLALATALSPDGDPADVDIPLTQAEIAEVVGTTRPTANQVLGSLAADGAIALARGRVSIVDVDLLGRRGC